MPITELPEIPEDTFVRPYPGPDNRIRTNHMKYIAAEHLVRGTVEACGVSLWQLAALVGQKWPQEVYAWASGKKRPSLIYQCRMHYLVILHAKYPGKVFWMKCIDWDTGKITWKDGVPFA